MQTTSTHSRTFALTLVVLLTACAGETEPKSSAGAADTGVDSHDTGFVPETPATNWCEATLGGEAGDRALAQDLARAHVGQRLFGPSADWLGADGELVALLSDDESLSGEIVEQYAATFEDVCAADATETPTETVRIDIEADVAIIAPGLGEIDLGDTTTVIVDLRTPASDQAVTKALKATLKGTHTLAQRKVRKFTGFPSQDEDWTHYEVNPVDVPVTLTGTSDIERTLVILTGRRLSPQTATLVGGLRMSGKAAIAGHDVYAAVAESHWTGIEEQGLAWRAGSLSTESRRWPDVIPSDLPTSDLDEVLANIDVLDGTASPTGDAERANMVAYDRAAGMHASMLGRGAMRAALLVAYGTLDWFYTYFDLVGRDLDDALMRGLEEVGSLAHGDRTGMNRIMGRFMHDLYDGHGFYSDYASTDWPDGWMAVQIQQIEGLPVVRYSLAPGIDPGDTIIAVDDTPIEDWYEEAMSRYSAASDGYRFVLATDELTEVRGTPQWTLRDPSGAERTVTAEASDWSDVEDTPWGGTTRPTGWLEDMGAPNVYFVNMAGNITPNEAQAEADLAEAESTAGVILDMRDYPNLDIYEFARIFNQEHFSAPLFGHPTWTGASDFEIAIEAWTFNRGTHVVDEPVILLVSNKSVSAAECFAQMVMGLENVTVIGQQSASTNGTITNAWLPGQLQITFTGMRLTNPDGSEFHGIGVVPDIEVTADPADFAAGIDPELQEALDALGY